VERFFELKNFAAHVHGDFSGEVAAGDRGRDFSDVAYLASQVAGHEVDVVGQVFPCAAHPGHFGLPPASPFGADFAGHAGNFAGEGIELVHHRINGVFEFENFAFHIHGDFARKVALGHGGGDFGDVADLCSEVSGHGIYRVGQILPSARHAGDV